MIDWDGERLTLTATTDWERAKFAALYAHLKQGAALEVEFIERRAPALSLVLTAVAAAPETGERTSPRNAESAPLA
jgi:hypothetical protein